jgi:hypothetical protein
MQKAHEFMVQIWLKKRVKLKIEWSINNQCTEIQNQGL